MCRRKHILEHAGQSSVSYKERLVVDSVTLLSLQTLQTDIEWIRFVSLLVTNGKLVKKYGYCEDQVVSVQQN